ncbi:unnamed protein product [Coregonus sp. 'balchen']|nr:unnamed protein product [Coregonus sp. 'balchen']
MSKLQWLNVFLTERLTAAAMEIFGAVERRKKNDTRVPGRDHPFETGEQSPTDPATPPAHHGLDSPATPPAHHGLDSPVTPPAHHGLDSPATPPAEVSNAQIYRAVMNLSHMTARVKDDLNCVVGGLKLEIGGLKKEVGGLKEHVVSLRDSLERDVHQLGPVPAKRKRARSSLVAETVRRLHNSVVNLVHRYQPKDKVNSPHNKMVSAYLIREASKESLGVTHDVLRAASVTYYETVRRNFLMQLPENRKKSEDTRIDKRWRSRRKRLLDSRTAMLQSHEEKDLWEGVTSELMSDEEDTMVDDKLVWLVKPPAFRSMELSELCAVLQNRLDKHPKTKALPRTPRLPSGLMSMREPPRTFHQDRHAQADLIEERTPLMPSAGDNQRFNSPGVTLLTVKEEEEMD